MKSLTLALIFFPLLVFGQTPGTSILNGKFIGPAGVTVVIQKDGTDDLTLTAKANGNQVYTVNEFKFPKAYVTGSAYTVSVKSFPPGITCRIEKGVRGTIGLSPGFIRVGADYTYDHLSHSTDNKVFATFYRGQTPVLGGSFEEEGRYAAFVSNAEGLEGGSGKHRQIYWRDRKNGITKLISRAANGNEGDGDSFAPAISSDGKSVAFESYSANLIPGDNNNLRDVYKWSASDNSLILVSKSGAQANGESYEPSISGDGNTIAFTSGANNLTAGVEGTAMVNVYLKDLSSGNIKLLTIDPKTNKAVGGSSPSISDDGSRVAFCSFASTLVENDKNGLWDIFIYDNASPILKRVSMGMGGSERTQGNESTSRIVSPAISGNGNYVAYATTAPNMVSGDTNGAQDVFLTNIQTMSTVRISTGSNGEQLNGDSPIAQGEKPGLSFDGNLVVFTTNANNSGVPAGNILLRNFLTGEIIPITSETGVQAGRPTISRSGGYVAFGIGAKLDGRFSSSGLFARFTGLTRCLACNE